MDGFLFRELMAMPLLETQLVASAKTCLNRTRLNSTIDLPGLA